MSDLPLPQGWKDEPLSTLVERLESGVSVNSEDKPCAPDEFGILKTSCVNGGKFDPSQNKVIVANEVFRAALNPRADSVLVSRMNTFDLVGETAYVGGDFPNLFVPDRLWQTVLRGGLETSTKWLSFVVQSPEFRAGVSRAATGTSGSMKNISQGSYLAIRTRIPPPPQQRRIAEILTTVDEAMEQTEALVGKLEQMKAGLMHDLFTRGVTPDGHLRPTRQEAPHLYHPTPLGWLPKEWEVSCCANQFEIDSGITLGPHRRPNKSPHPYLRVANVHRDRLELEDVAQLEATPSEIAGDCLKTYDLLVVEGHANRNEIGRCAMVFENAEGMLFQNHLFRLRPNRLKPRMALLWMNSFHAQSYWESKCATSSGLNTINRKLLGAMPVLVPPSAEQEWISEAAYSLRDRIAVETTHLAKLRQQKQGLMQDLLTGRVRVG